MSFHNNPKVGTSLISFYREANCYTEGLFPKVTEHVGGKARTYPWDSSSLLHSRLQLHAMTRLYQLI